MQEKHVLDYTTSNFDEIVNLTEYCSQNLKDSEWGVVHLSLLPPIYRFKFYCPKQKFWAILHS